MPVPANFHKVYEHTYLDPRKQESGRPSSPPIKLAVHWQLFKIVKTPDGTESRVPVHMLLEGLDYIASLDGGDTFGMTFYLDVEGANPNMQNIAVGLRIYDGAENIMSNKDKLAQGVMDNDYHYTVALGQPCDVLGVGKETVRAFVTKGFVDNPTAVKAKSLQQHRDPSSKQAKPMSIYFSSMPIEKIEELNQGLGNVFQEVAPRPFRGARPFNTTRRHRLADTSVKLLSPNSTDDDTDDDDDDDDEYFPMNRGVQKAKRFGPMGTPMGAAAPRRLALGQKMGSDSEYEESEPEQRMGSDSEDGKSEKVAMGRRRGGTAMGSDLDSGSEDEELTAMGAGEFDDEEDDDENEVTPPSKRRRPQAMGARKYMPPPTSRPFPVGLSDEDNPRRSDKLLPRKNQPTAAASLTQVSLAVGGVVSRASVAKMSVFTHEHFNNADPKDSISFVIRFKRELIVHAALYDLTPLALAAPLNVRATSAVNGAGDDDDEYGDFALSEDPPPPAEKTEVEKKDVRERLAKQETRITEQKTRLLAKIKTLREKLAALKAKDAAVSAPSPTEQLLIDCLNQGSSALPNIQFSFSGFRERALAGADDALSHIGSMEPAVNAVEYSFECYNTPALERFDQHEKYLDEKIEAAEQGDRLYDEIAARRPVLARLYALHRNLYDTTTASDGLGVVKNDVPDVYAAIVEMACMEPQSSDLSQQACQARMAQHEETAIQLEQTFARLAAQRHVQLPQVKAQVERHKRLNEKLMALIARADTSRAGHLVVEGGEALKANLKYVGGGTRAAAEGNLLSRPNTYLSFQTYNSFDAPKLTAYIDTFEAKVNAFEAFFNGCEMAYDNRIITNNNGTHQNAALIEGLREKCNNIENPIRDAMRNFFSTLGPYFSPCSRKNSIGFDPGRPRFNNLSYMEEVVVPLSKPVEAMAARLQDLLNSTPAAQPAPQPHTGNKKSREVGSANVAFHIPAPPASTAPVFLPSAPPQQPPEGGSGGEAANNAQCPPGYNETMRLKEEEEAEERADLVRTQHQENPSKQSGVKVSVYPESSLGSLEKAIAAVATQRKVESATGGDLKHLKSILYSLLVDSPHQRLINPLHDHTFSGSARSTVLSKAAFDLIKQHPGDYPALTQHFGYFLHGEYSSAIQVALPALMAANSDATAFLSRIFQGESNDVVALMDAATSIFGGPRLFSSMRGPSKTRGLIERVAVSLTTFTGVVNNEKVPSKAALDQLHSNVLPAEGQSLKAKGELLLSPY